MSRKNKSYPAELKYQAVADYLSGVGSLRAICKKYKIGNKKRLQDWIKLYNSHKELKCHTGGSRMTKGRDTTYEERIALVHECIENGYNYTGMLCPCWGKLAKAAATSPSLIGRAHV